MTETALHGRRSLEDYIRSSWGPASSKPCQLCRRQPALLGDHFCITCRCELVGRFTKTLETIYGLLPEATDPEPATRRVMRARKHRGLRSRRIRPD